MLKLFFAFFSLLTLNLFPIDSFYTQQNIKRKNKKQLIIIRIGLCADYPPFELLNKNEEIVGKNKKVLEKLLQPIRAEYASQYEIKLKYKRIGFEEGFLLLENNSIDIFAGSVSPSPEREKHFTFIAPVFSTNLCLVKKRKDLGIIAVQIGSLQEEYAMASYPNNKIIRVPLIFDMIFLFNNNRVDSLVINSHVYSYFKKLTNLTGDKVMLDRQEQIGFAMRKKTLLSNKFDQIIAPKILKSFIQYQNMKKSNKKIVTTFFLL